MSRRIVVWLRNDLRLHDHDVFAECGAGVDVLLAVYCLDPRQFGEHPLGFARCGARRATFLLQTLASLRADLRARGGELHVAIGRPGEVIAGLASRYAMTDVFCEAETTSEERAAERELRAALPETVALHRYWGHTLIHRDDLPFDVEQLPDVFTAFRKKVEKNWRVRRPLDAPDTLPPPPDGFAAAPPPTLADLGLDEPDDDPRRALTFVGGEGAGLDRLDHYLWRARAIVSYKDTRNGLLGADYSSKLSPWLACGALSPRRVYAEIDRFETEDTANDSTYWLVFELLWRDYFRFVALRYGDRIFRRSGLRGGSPRFRDDETAFRRWRRGDTGEPFVDANMRELAATGFMSNRGRQNVASYLAHDLGVDWRWGAAWFESCLIDYDVCSNQGNWMYVAGVGNDPRQGRRFNVRGQAERYDPQRRYVRHWLGDSTT